MIFLNINEFKDKLKKYKQGVLTEGAERKFENELEKLDEYQAFLEAETGEMSNGNDYSLETERKIIKRSQLFAYLQVGLIALVTSLLLLPTLNLLAMALNIIP